MATSFTLESVSKMLVNELKVELKKRMLSTIGKKSELVDRLMKELKSKDELSTDDPEEENNEKDLPIVIDHCVEATSGNNNQTESQEIVANSVAESFHKPDSDMCIPLAVNSNVNVSAEHNQVVLNYVETVTEQASNKIEHTVNEESINDLDNNLLRRKIIDSTENGEVVTSEPNLTSVRIDYFQRPLNLKYLIQWLEEVCKCKINESCIWINSIKTHCYLDFTTSSEAKYCIETVSGMKYPPTNTNKLVANFTSITSKDAAAGALEAQMKPGEWQGFTKNNVNIPSMSGNKRRLDMIDDKQNGPSDRINSSQLSGAKGTLFKRVATSTIAGENQSKLSVQEIVRTNGKTMKPLENQMEGNGNNIKVLPQGKNSTKVTPSIVWYTALPSVIEKRLKEKMLQTRNKKRIDS